MSPSLLAILQRIDRETRRVHVVAHRAYPDSARYPRDYYRPAELLLRYSGRWDLIV